LTSRARAKTPRVSKRVLPCAIRKKRGGISRLCPSSTGGETSSSSSPKKKRRGEREKNALLAAGSAENSSGGYRDLKGEKDFWYWL